VPGGYSSPPHSFGGDDASAPEHQRPSRPFSPELAPVLERMRAGVRSQVDDADAATHYDLGVAYMEMGLDSDAISELTLAARDPSRECVCLSMIGSIHLKASLNDKALDALHRALNARIKTREQELRIGYEIANTYELKMMPEQALHYFEWLAKLEGSYDDPRGSVAERIERLRTESGAQPRPQRPASTPDAAELGSALDDLFGEGN
jgi:tetratricopeptide (TPR) repeat protein